MKRFAAVCPEKGVFLGVCLGLCFWSKIDSVGQTSAVVMEDPATFKEIFHDTHEIAEVECVDPNYATIEECVAAGLPAWNP